MIPSILPSPNLLSSQNTSSNQEQLPLHFIRNKFLHSSRLWLSFIPCTFIVIILGGKITLGAILIGIILSWLFDLINLEEGTLITFWLTLLASEVGVIISSIHLLRASVFNIFLIFNIAFFIFLVAVWGTLHFTIIQESAVMTLSLERVLISTIWIPTSVLLTWFSTGFSGIEAAPYYNCVILYLLYLIYGLPLPSSYLFREKTGSSREHSNYIQGPIESAIQTVFMLAMPSCFYVAIYIRVLLTSWFHISNWLILLFLPLLLLRFTIPHNSLWWTGLNSIQLQRVSHLITVSSALVLTGCFEYRVVFRAFSHSIALFPPWSYIWVTIALYALVGLLLYLFSVSSSSSSSTSSSNTSLLANNKSLSQNMVIALSGLSAVAGGFTLGIPWILFPVALAGSFAFALFVTRGRHIRDYLIFVGCTAVILLWFMTKMFWFLDFTFRNLSLSLQTTTEMLTVMFVVAFLLPGFLLLNTSSHLSGVLLIMYSVMIAITEQTFYWEQAGIYPSFLIILTTVVGCYLTLKLEHEKKITSNASWIVFSVFLAKLALLLPPSKMAVASSFLLILTISPLYMPTSPTTKMTRQQGIIHALSIGIAAFMTRHSLPAKLVSMILQQEEPSEPILLATAVILWALSCLPLSLKYFSHLPIARNVNLLLLIAGALFIALQPEFTFGTASSPYNNNNNSVDKTNSVKRWPLMGFYLSILASLWGLTSPTFQRSELMRYIYCAFAGVSFGLFVSQTYLVEPTILLNCLFIAIFVLVLSLIVFTVYPSASMVRLLPFIFAGFEILLAVTFVAEGRAFSYIPGTRGKDLLLNSRVILLALYAAGNVAIALLMKYKHSLNPVVQIQGKTRRTSQQEQTRRQLLTSSGNPAHSLRSARITVEMDWVPTVGNLAALLGLILSVLLNIEYLGGSQTCIFFLAPLLLLLSQDKWIFKGLTSQTRYVPLIACTSLFLAGAAFKEIAQRGLLVNYVAYGQVALSSVQIVKELMLLVMTLPSHYRFLQFLWTFANQNDAQFFWIIITPLNILAALFSSISAIQMLGVIGVLASTVQYFINNQIQQRGRNQI